MCRLLCVEKGRKTGADRVLRGGAWNNKARNVRCACRNQNAPDNRNNDIGFRPARAHDWTRKSKPEQTLIPVGQCSTKLNGPLCVSSLWWIPGENPWVGRILRVVVARSYLCCTPILSRV